MRNCRVFCPFPPTASSIRQHGTRLFKTHIRQCLTCSLSRLLLCPPPSRRSIPLKGAWTKSSRQRGKTTCLAPCKNFHHNNCLYDDCIKWESLLDINAEKPISILLSDWQNCHTIHHPPLLPCRKTNVEIISDINVLILDYLTMEGYPNAAAKFSKEANLQPQQDIASIRARQEIQNCIHSGNIQSAIEMLNELDPEVSKIVF